MSAAPGRPKQADAPSPPALPSLDRRVLRHVMVPLAATWLAGTLVALGVAQYFTQRAFDRSLLDDAYLLASNVRLEGDALRLTLTPREVSTVLFDQTESLYFSVHRPDGSLVAGQASLRAPPGVEGATSFGDIEHDGRTVRAVVLHRELPAPFDVVMAETTVGRSRLLNLLLLYSLAPQLLLLLPLAWWLRRAITRDMLPLAQLQQAVDHRNANDLTPVPVHATTRDVQGLATALNALLARIESSVRAQREFAGNVAHELRTPLAGIRALADYGLAQKDPAAWRDQLERIASSQARASRLVDQLLELAVAHEAEAGLRMEPVALDALVHDAVLRFLPRADAAGVDLGARGIDAPAWVEGDATLIEGILNNLLDNALRYGVTGAQGPAAVTVGLEVMDDETVLSVQDNGSG
ncbi:MAG: sensor histidine kinase, partial [Ramlibacter sp.]